MSVWIAMLFIIPLKCFSFDYFDKKIDYWNEAKPQDKKEIVVQKKEPEPEQESKSFDWNKYLDPKNDEFFKEGDYTPPKPFMELVRNPTDQNIKNWFKLMETKNKLSSRLQKRITEFNSQGVVDKRVSTELSQVAEQSKPFEHDFSRYRFRLYFDSKCPYCKKMFSTMKELQNLGYFVELRQLDSDLSVRKKLPFPVHSVSKKELHKRDIQGVPVLFVGDLKKKLVYRLKGYQTTESIFTKLASEKAYK